MSGKGSTLFTVGTLLRHAQDAGAPVRLLVQGTWLDGRIVVIVWTCRGHSRRIISMRKGNDREKALFAEQQMERS